MRPRSILFLCPDNAVRSIMAEAYLRQIGRPLAKAFSAGPAPAEGPDDSAIAVLQDVGIRTGGLASKSIETYTVAGAPAIDLVVALCDMAEIVPIPRLRGEPQLIEWPVQIPDATQSSRDGYLEIFGSVRVAVDSLLFEFPGVAPVRVPQVA